MDGPLVAFGRGTLPVSRWLRTYASGHAQHYGLIMAAGFLALLALALMVP